MKLRLVYFGLLVFALIVALGALSVPGFAASTTVGLGVNISWTDGNSSSATYTVYQGIGACLSNPPLATIATGVAVKNFAVSGLPAGQPLCFVVEADEAGFTPVSSDPNDYKTPLDKPHVTFTSRVDVTLTNP